MTLPASTAKGHSPPRRPAAALAREIAWRLESPTIPCTVRERREIRRIGETQTLPEGGGHIAEEEE